MARASGGVSVSVGLLAAAALVGGWFALGTLASSTDEPAPAYAWAPDELGPAVPVTAAPSAVASDVSTAVQMVDRAWLAQTAARTGIPERPLAAYAAAELVLAGEQPGCGVGWNTLAGIGAIESGHGTHGGSAIDAAGNALPRILGPALDGNGFAAIPDTEGGVWDSDPVWDRAVGPMQFIPSTWARWGADGNGDGATDPNNIDDAALAAGRYLCASGSMLTGEGWRAAIFSYNHLNSYVDAVAAEANRYAQG